MEFPVGRVSPVACDRKSSGNRLAFRSQATGLTHSFCPSHALENLTSNHQYVLNKPTDSPQEPLNSVKNPITRRVIGQQETASSGELVG
jgi:hypothetical protein